MRLPALALAAALLVAGALCARASDARRAAPRAAPGVASLLGGFSALAVQVLWQRADRAVTEHREDDAQIAFAAIEELEPQLVSGGDFIARSLGFDLADGHTDPAARWSFAREGWRVLRRVVAMNPGDARAYAVRGRYALLRLSTDDAMRAGFTKEFEPTGPLERARLDFEEALLLRPQWREPWDGVAIASSMRANELFESGESARASKLYRRAHDAYRHIVGILAAEVEPALVANRDAKADDAQLTAALADVCEAPPSERAARLDALRLRFAGAPLPEAPKR